MEHGSRPEALSDYYDIADDVSVAVDFSPSDGKLEGSEVIATPIAHSPFMTYSDKPSHPSAHAQDMVGFTSARSEALRSSKDLVPQKIADKEEERAVQKFLGNDSDMTSGSAAIGVMVTGPRPIDGWEAKGPWGS